MASLPRRRRPSVSFAEKFAWRFSFPIYRVGLKILSSPIEAFGFKSLMHFSYYLMIAALTLIGFEVIYALYQLATFVL
jgi:hypothetical protein